MFRRLPAALVVGLLSLATITPPDSARADAVVTVNLTPRNQTEADLLRFGLTLNALRQTIRQSQRDGAVIRQTGQGNALVLSQGATDWALIRQRGDGHSADLNQSGGGNAQVILQSGRNTGISLSQSGNQLGIVIQHGF